MPETQNTLATIHTEAFFGNLGAFANTVAVAMQDGKLSLTEGFNIALGLVPFGDSIQNFKAHTLAELKDLHRSEVERIVNTFSNRFDIANDQVEEFIEECVRFVLSSTAMFNVARRMFGKNA